MKGQSNSERRAEGWKEAGGQKAGSRGRQKGKRDGETLEKKSTGDCSHGQSLGQRSRRKREVATVGSCCSLSHKNTSISSLKEKGLMIASYMHDL